MGTCRYEVPYFDAIKHAFGFQRQYSHLGYVNRMGLDGEGRGGVPLVNSIYRLNQNTCIASTQHPFPIKAFPDRTLSKTIRRDFFVGCPGCVRPHVKKGASHVVLPCPRAYIVKKAEYPFKVYSSVHR